MRIPVGGAEFGMLPSALASDRGGQVAGAVSMRLWRSWRRLGESRSRLRRKWKIDRDLT